MNTVELVFKGFVCSKEYARAVSYVDELMNLSEDEFTDTACLFHMQPERFKTVLQNMKANLSTPECFRNMQMQFCQEEVQLSSSDSIKQIFNYGLKLAFSLYKDRLLKKTKNNRTYILSFEFDPMPIPGPIFKSAANVPIRNVHAEVHFGGDVLHFDSPSREIGLSDYTAKTLLEYAETLVDELIVDFIHQWDQRYLDMARADVSFFLKMAAFLARNDEWPGRWADPFMALHNGPSVGKLLTNTDLYYLQEIERHPDIDIYEDRHGIVLYFHFANTYRQEPAPILVLEKTEEGFRLANTSGTVFQRFQLMVGMEN